MLDILGDKWTLLIVRDLFSGKKRYGEFQNSPEKIPSNILANRLSRLLDNKIVSKKPYQNNPIRYEYFLTKKGCELEPVLKAMVTWGGEILKEAKPKYKKPNKPFKLTHNAGFVLWHSRCAPFCHKPNPALCTI